MKMYEYVIEIILGNTILHRLNPDSLGLDVQSTLMVLLLDQKEKGRELKKKKTTSASLTMLKPLTMWITTNHGKSLKRWEYQTTLPVSWETGKKQQLESDMEQQMHSKLGKEYIKVAYCQLTYLTSMQSTSCEMPYWMTHKLELRLPGGQSTISDLQMIL